ncbi:hypothetical protein [Saccharothrix sp. HUAS TT1]|uniref:hypothetical protein n=1 Tax=unclassified Saccharothrix TaxID=2593673 RepID=UPI00345BB008
MSSTHPNAVAAHGDDQDEELPTGLSAEQAVADFAVGLQRVKRRAGDPPYRVLSKSIGCSAATITRALHGQTQPTWEFTEKFLLACGATAEVLPQWRARWAGVRDLARPLAAGAEEPEPDREVAQHCSTCGAVVGDQVKHRRWHEEYRPGPPDDGGATVRRLFG